MFTDAERKREYLPKVRSDHKMNIKIQASWSTIQYYDNGTLFIK